MKKWKMYAIGMMMCVGMVGCQRQSVADIIEAQENASRDAQSQEKSKQALPPATPEISNYKKYEEQVVNKPNYIVKARLVGRHDVVSVEEGAYNINIEKVQLADDFTELPEEQREYFTTYQGGELIEYCNVDERMFVFITVKVQNTQDKEIDFCARNLQLYNIYKDKEQKYNYFYGLTKDFVVIYGNDYDGTRHSGVVKISAGEEREFVVAFYNVAKHQLKSSNGFTGEKQYYENCALENTYMKTSHASGAIVQDESLIYLGVENNRVEE